MLFSYKTVAYRAVASTLAGWLLMVLAIYPTWTLMNFFFLVLVFPLMSLLCISYIIHAISTYSGFVRYDDSNVKFFYGVSDCFVIAMTLFSTHCCLYSVDPTNCSFYYLSATSVIMGAGGILAAKIIDRRKLGMGFRVLYGRTLPIVVFVLCVAVSRSALFLSGALVCAIAYCVFTVFLLVWLVLELYGLRQRIQAANETAVR